MRHCHFSLCCNDLPFLKQKLPFLYKHFEQIIFVDFDILNNCNSKDGSLEYIKAFPDQQNKIILLSDFDPKKITKFFGRSLIEKRKMFAYGSSYIKDDIDLVWATDLDEFFEETLIETVEREYKNDRNLTSIDIPHINFCFNQYNIFDYDKLFYIKPRVTKHLKNKVYGHCNFDTYGKTKKLTNEFLYHFSYVGYRRCHHKLALYNKKSNHKHLQNNWCELYLKSLENKDKYIDFVHPGSKRIRTKKYDGSYPSYINIDEMINELNKV